VMQWTMRAVSLQTVDPRTGKVETHSIGCDGGAKDSSAGQRRGRRWWRAGGRSSIYGRAMPRFLIFDRRGADLCHDVDLAPWEAVLGPPRRRMRRRTALDPLSMTKSLGRSHRRRRLVISAFASPNASCGPDLVRGSHHEHLGRMSAFAMLSVGLDPIRVLQNSGYHHVVQNKGHPCPLTP
jgi:hypothetical protein